MLKITEEGEDIFLLRGERGEAYLNRATGRFAKSYEACAESEPPALVAKPRITQYIFQLTQGCNLRCRHCFNEFYGERETKCMDIETAKEIIDLTTDYAEKEGITEFSWVFHGGESSLCMETLEFACRYLTEQPVNYRLSIQTNGVLMHRLLPLVKKYGLGISLSVDGLAEHHNAIRVYPSGEGSFAAVLRGMEMLRSHGVSFHPLVTVSKFNAREIDRVLRFISGYTGSISSIYIFNRPELAPSQRDVEVYAEKCLRFLTGSYLHGRVLHYRELSVALLHLFSQRRYACSRSPCAACTGVVTVDPGGNVYPCDCMIAEEWKMGNLLESGLQKLLSSKPAKLIRKRDYRKIEGCRECLYGAVCMGDCPSHAWAERGDINTTSSKCAYNRTFLTELLAWLVDKRIPQSYVSYTVETCPWG